MEKIIYTSWGYDQTNVDFFKVIRETASTVWAVRIGAKVVPGTEGFMCRDLVPDPTRVIEPEAVSRFKKRLNAEGQVIGYSGCETRARKRHDESGKEYTETYRECYRHTLWDHKEGETHYNSSYA